MDPSKGIPSPWASAPTRRPQPSSCGPAAVDAIVTRVVADNIDQQRLDEALPGGRRRGLLPAGPPLLDRGGRIITRPCGVAGKRQTGAALEAFHEALGEPPPGPACRRVSTDLGATHRDATRHQVPEPVICFDPFRVVQLANRAPDAVNMSPGRPAGALHGRGWRPKRYALRAADSPSQPSSRCSVRQTMRTDDRGPGAAGHGDVQLRAPARLVQPRRPAFRTSQSWCSTRSGSLTARLSSPPSPPCRQRRTPLGPHPPLRRATLPELMS